MRQEAKEPRSEPPMVPAKAPRDRSPALAWLFLVGLLPSRARLRFTRQEIIRRGLSKDDIEGLRGSGNFASQGYALGYRVAPLRG